MVLKCWVLLCINKQVMFHKSSNSSTPRVMSYTKQNLNIQIKAISQNAASWGNSTLFFINPIKQHRTRHENTFPLLICRRQHARKRKWFKDSFTRQFTFGKRSLSLLPGNTAFQENQRCNFSHFLHMVKNGLLFTFLLFTAYYKNHELNTTIWTEWNIHTGGINFSITIFIS